MDKKPSKIRIVYSWVKKHPIWTGLGIILPVTWALVGLMEDAWGRGKWIADNWEWLVGLSSSPYFPWLISIISFCALGAMIWKAASNDANLHTERMKYAKEVAEPIVSHFNTLHRAQLAQKEAMEIDRIIGNYREISENIRNQANDGVPEAHLLKIIRGMDGKITELRRQIESSQTRMGKTEALPLLPAPDATAIGRNFGGFRFGAGVSTDAQNQIVGTKLNLDRNIQLAYNWQAELERIIVG